MPHHYQMQLHLHWHWFLFFFFNSGQFLAWCPKFFREWSTVLFHSNDIDDVYLEQTCVHHPGHGYCIGNNTCQFHLPLVYPNLLFTVMTKRKMSRHQTFCIAVQESIVLNRKHSRITQPSSKSEIHFEISSLTHLKLRFEKCRPVDSKTSTSKSTRFARALASIILAGKGVRSTFYYEFWRKQDIKCWTFYHFAIGKVCNLLHLR